jgi:hypothetical protein
MATSGLDSVQAQALVAASVGQATLIAFGGTSGKLKLIASGAAEATNGTEITPGGSYSAGGIPFVLSSTWGSPSYATGVAQVTNSGAAITQTNMPAVTATQVEIWDEAGTPKRWWFAGITSVTTNSGDTLTFATSAVTAEFQI